VTGRHCGMVVVGRGGAQWGGIPAWERRKEELSEGWDASGVLGGFYRGRGAPERGGWSNGAVNGFNAIEDGGKVKRGIKGGWSDGGAAMARAECRDAERAARGAAARWNSVVTLPGSASTGCKTELTAEARLTER
jgi:hypothetical protein